MKGVTDDLAVLLELDITYMGGGSIAIETTLTAGLSIPVRVHLSGFSGKLRVRVPSVFWPDMLAVAFVEDPGVSFIVDSPLTVRDNEMVRGVVNRLLASLMRKVFVEMWVLPSWRNFFLPLMIPSPVEEVARMSAINGKPQTMQKKANLTSKAATLWESRSPLLKNTLKQSTATGPAFLDVIGVASFSTSEPLSSTPNVEELNSKLSNPFLALALDKRQDLEFLPNVDKGLVSLPDNEDFVNLVSSLQWKTTKNRAGVCLQKSKAALNGMVGDISRAFVSINCDAERVFAVLSNPEHFRHIEDTFSDFSIMKVLDETSSIRHMSFALSRSAPKDLNLYELRKKVKPVAGTEETVKAAPWDAYIVAMRSVTTLKDEGNACERLESKPELSQGAAVAETIAEALITGSEPEALEEAGEKASRSVAEKKAFR
ncbi:hypothetical protein BC829DRAFT_238570 [Chytridium lagenaria]|nr:hypothetical protein BC829DRAFT_238570 [Chytridium lagenaria]